MTEHMQETKQYTFKRIKKTVTIGRVSCNKFINNPMVPAPLLAIRDMDEKEVKALGDLIDFNEYLDFAEFVGKFNGTKEDIEKK